MTRTVPTPRLLLASLSAVLLVAACGRAAPVVTAPLPPPALPTPSTNSAWKATQAVVLELFGDNKQAAADSTLLHFARSVPRTPEGDRARWWRALMRADPRVTNGDVAVAIAQIDSLLTDSIVTEVRAEAVLMRRVISSIDSLRRAEVRRRTQSTQVAGERLDELKAARDSMTRLQAEIVRLRQRLKAQP
jgi:hypothetical protein